MGVLQLQLSFSLLFCDFSVQVYLCKYLKQITMAINKEGAVNIQSFNINLFHVEPFHRFKTQRRKTDTRPLRAALKCRTTCSADEHLSGQKPQRRETVSAFPLQTQALVPNVMYCIPVLQHIHVL
jgi:hypothetical protein